MEKNTTKKAIPEESQEEIKRILQLEYLTRAKLDAYNGNLYLLRDIFRNQKKSKIHRLGWKDPKEIPFYPTAGAGFVASTSGSQYNIDQIIVGKEKIEYDFSEAYTNIMRSYYLPSNTFLSSIKYDCQKIKKRFAEYHKTRPYRELKTFIFMTVDIKAIANESTYTEWGGMLANYTRFLTGIITVSEIELKLIYDFYEIKQLVVLDSFVFQTCKGMLDDYFSRIDKLKNNELTNKYYKGMRNKIYGTIGKLEMTAADRKFQFPDDMPGNPKFAPYNRAFSAMVAGVFRDRIARYEQKYVNSEYGLINIRTDGLYFRKEVPEFEKLHAAGVVKKKIHVITEEDLTN